MAAHPESAQPTEMKQEDFVSSPQAAETSPAEEPAPREPDVTNLIVPSITAGWDHTCYLSEAGSVLCWGWDRFGQVGDGEDSTSERSPVRIVGLDPVKSISAGGAFTCAVTLSGNVSCWGQNRFGQLGQGEGKGEREMRDVPVQVPGLRDVRSVSAGGAHACALLRDGTVSCWGANEYGQLGDGQRDRKERPYPAPVLGLSDVKMVTAGWHHTCALIEGGSVKCWGRDSDGQLGDGEISPYEASGIPHVWSYRARPVRVVGLSDIVSVGAGFRHTCALHDNGRVSCWGGDSYGQLGGGGSTRGARQSPQRLGALYFAKSLFVGPFHSCAVLEDTTARCWGIDGNGELGDGSARQIRDRYPVAPLDLSEVLTMGLGDKHTCAIVQGGSVYCWGFNGRGQLGNGDENHYTREAPIRVPSLSAILDEAATSPVQED